MILEGDLVAFDWGALAPKTLREIAEEKNILVPAKATLKNYGMVEDDWLTLLDEQGWVCGVCGQLPAVSPRYKARRFVTDHEHKRGFKKMTPEQRQACVRGILCWWCNAQYVGRGITVAKALGVVAYLRRYEERTA